MLVVGKWYLENIKKPEATAEDQFVLEGLLSTANDYGYNQSTMALEMAREILEQGFNPAHMRPRTPARGPLMVNTLRPQSRPTEFVQLSEIRKQEKPCNYLPFCGIAIFAISSGR